MLLDILTNLCDLRTQILIGIANTNRHKLNLCAELLRFLRSLRESAGDHCTEAQSGKISLRACWLAMLAWYWRYAAIGRPLFWEKRRVFMFIEMAVQLQAIIASAALVERCALSVCACLTSD